MIPVYDQSLQQNGWQYELKNMFRSSESLFQYLGLDPQQAEIPVLPAGQDASFPVRVTRHFARLMKRSDWHDPLLRQVIPSAEEQLVVPGYTAEPLQEHNSVVTSGLIHKYQGRVLLVMGGACAVNCRYCFRRNFDYAEDSLSGHQVSQVIRYIQDNPEISEVIFSGGDPLLWPDRRLKSLTDQLSDIAHLKTLRVHSRVPVVLPERLDEGFLGWWNQLPFNRVMVVHCNHPQELSEDMSHALSGLQNTLILNQSVLLRGVNDSADTLAELAEKGFSGGILPYYLHLLDHVQGAAHFQVSDQHAVDLLKSLRSRLPGYLVPRLVREIPGQPNKTEVF